MSQESARTANFQNTRMTGPVIWALGLLVALPAILAIFEVSLGETIGFRARLVIWNVPWQMVGIIVVMAFVIEKRRTNTPFPTMARLDLFLILTLLLQSVSLGFLVSGNSELAYMQTGLMVLGLLVGIVAYDTTGRYQQKFSSFLYVAILVAIVLTLPFLLMLVGLQYDNPDIYWKMRLPGFGPVRLYGYALEVGIIMGIGLLVSPLASAPKWRVLLWAATIVLWVALFWSGGRGATAAIFGGLVVTSLVFPAKAMRLALVTVTSAAIGALGSLPLWMPAYSSFGLLHRLSETTVDDVSNGRIERWRDAIGVIMEKPLFGYGPEQFSNLWGGYYVDGIAQQGAAMIGGSEANLSVYFLAQRNLHNIAFEALVGWGIVGAVAIFFLLFRAWLRALKRARISIDQTRLPAFFALNALLFHSLVSGTYNFYHSVFYLALFFGICLAPVVRGKT